MRKQTLRLVFAILGSGLISVCGCATSQPQHIAPLSYVALMKPVGAIKASGQRVETKHPRGGGYFLNYGFRPAPDIGSYIEQAQGAAGADILKNADVQLKVPFAIDILMFGFQFGEDTVIGNQ